MNNTLVLDHKDIMESVAGIVMKVKTFGQDQLYIKVVDELLSRCVTPFTDQLPNNKRPLVSHPAVKWPSERKSTAAVNEE